MLTSFFGVGKSSLLEHHYKAVASTDLHDGWIGRWREGSENRKPQN